MHVNIVDVYGNEARFYRRDRYGRVVCPWRKLSAASRKRLETVLTGVSVRTYAHNPLIVYFPNILQGGIYRKGA